jgi:hypothetical protein
MKLFKCLQGLTQISRLLKHCFRRLSLPPYEKYDPQKPFVVTRIQAQGSVHEALEIEKIYESVQASLLD